MNDMNSVILEGTIIKPSVPSGGGSVLLPMTRIAVWRTDCPREEESDD